MPQKPTDVVPETRRDIKRATSINPDGIQEEYVAVPSDLARWNAIYVEAVSQLRHAELDLEVWENQAMVGVCTDAEKRGEKAPAIDKIKWMVRSQPRYRELCEEVIALEEAKASAAGVVEAVRAKREMLVSLGAHLRADAERDLYLKDRTRGRG
jgi:hypothetical protein